MPTNCSLVIHLYCFSFELSEYEMLRTTILRNLIHFLVFGGVSAEVSVCWGLLLLFTVSTTVSEKATVV